ncbi:MAG TPA: proton-conducting membrane transporter, partial [Actinobacteria bacterium]|nr:proton-conducting membrane transporter [Actinomycetota bacterium]
AHAALIARYGADWFRAAGTAAFPGTALMSVGGAVRRPGVYEAALGTTLASLLQRAGGPAEAPAAVLAGGYFGGWLPLPAAQHIPLSDEALRPAGASLGPGVLVLLP